MSTPPSPYIKEETQMEHSPISIPFPRHTHPSRSPGTHLSDILDFIEAMAFGKKKFKETPNSYLFAEMGFMWERVAKAQDQARLGELFIDPELCLDGIYLSPDGVDLLHNNLIEYKFTWKSSARTPTWENQRWMWQTKAYCKALGMDRVLFRVLYINGSYYPFEPVYDNTLCVFSQEELDNNWNMVLTNAREGGFIT